MRYIKEFNNYEPINEDLKSTLVKTSLIASLFLKSLNVIPATVTKDSINKIEMVAPIVKDSVLTNILSDIQSNLSSTDSVKYVELFNRLSSHLQKNYHYQIAEKNIDKIENTDDFIDSIKHMSIYEIMGWLGSICLAICGLPQAWVSYKDKHSHGISWAFLLLWAFGEMFALMYVYDKIDVPLVLNYGINILIISVILYFKFKPQSPPPNQSSVNEGIIEKKSIDEVLELFLNIIEKWGMEERDSGILHTKSSLQNTNHIFYTKSIREENDKGNLIKKLDDVYSIDNFNMKYHYGGNQKLVIEIIFGGDASDITKDGVSKDVKMIKDRLDRLGYVSAYWFPEGNRISMHIATSDSYPNLIVQGFPGYINGYPPKPFVDKWLIN